MMRSLWIVALVALSACSSSSQYKNDFEVTDVPCFLARGTRYSKLVTNALSVEIHGPDACQRVLEVFLESHPEERIVSVIPIAHAPPPRTDPGLMTTTPGTQRLLVFHTATDGPWPLARELGVDEITCYDEDERGRSRFLCRENLLKFIGTLPPIAISLPITKNAETDKILILYRVKHQ
jgi:hypothetical protein